MTALQWPGARLAKRPSRLVVLSAFGAALVWLIVTTNLSIHLLETWPETALALAPGNPAVLLELAERKILRSGAARSTDEAAGPAASDSPWSSNLLDEQERKQARAWAQSALARSPLDARAFRVLGQLEPDETEAAKLMEAAARRSLNETRAHFWLLRRRFAQRRYAGVMRSADIVLRTRPRLLEFVAPYLARMAEDKAAAITLDRALARNPPWREHFLAVLPKAVTDVRAPLRVMLNLMKTPTPASESSRGAYLSFLFGRQAYDFAYYAWRRLLDPERSPGAGALYNADFAFPPSGSPFDWTIMSASGASIDIAPRPDDTAQRALMLDYGPGRAAPHGVVQFVKLAAGAYRMSGRYRGELEGRRGVRWRVACVGSDRRLGESEMALGRISSWRRFEFDFVIPEKGDCPLQSVRLTLDARSASEWIASGKMWYVDLRIDPVAADARPPT